MIWYCGGLFGRCQQCNKQQLAEQIRNREPKPLRQLCEDLPAELDAICLKCLAKSIPERWATAGDLAQALRAWLRQTHQPTTAQPSVRAIDLLPTISPAAIKPSRSKLTFLGLLISVLLIGTSVALWATMMPRRIVTPGASLNWSLDDLPLGKQFPLLERAARKRLWKDDDTNCTVHSDLTAARLNLDTDSMRLIELGETTDIKPQ